MDQKEIHTLAMDLADALQAEHQTKITAANVEACAEHVKTLVLGTAADDGTINGKNADTRKRQTAAVLADSEVYAAELNKVAKAQSAAVTREIERKRQEAVIGLTKAWLYSQSGRISIGLGT